MSSESKGAAEQTHEAEARALRLHDLRPARGSRQKRKRVGRGPSGHGNKTAGRGIKGQKSRTSVPAGFEGGQMPLQRRLPKWGGFTNPNRTLYAVVNVSKLAEAFEAGADVTPDTLHSKGIVGKGKPVKVLGHGEISKALTVKAHKFSKQAASKITSAGGTVEEV